MVERVQTGGAMNFEYKKHESKLKPAQKREIGEAYNLYYQRKKSEKKKRNILIIIIIVIILTMLFLILRTTS